jgi:hypothetical protein
MLNPLIHHPKHKFINYSTNIISNKKQRKNNQTPSKTTSVSNPPSPLDCINNKTSTHQHDKQNITVSTGPSEANPKSFTDHTQGKVQHPVDKEKTLIAMPSSVKTGTSVNILKDMKAALQACGFEFQDRDPCIHPALSSQILPVLPNAPEVPPPPPYCWSWSVPNILNISLKFS